MQLLVKMSLVMDGFEIVMVAIINSPLASMLPSSNSWGKQFIWLSKYQDRKLQEQEKSNKQTLARVEDMQED